MLTLSITWSTNHLDSIDSNERIIDEYLNLLKFLALIDIETRGAVTVSKDVFDVLFTIVSEDDIDSPNSICGIPCEPYEDFLDNCLNLGPNSENTFVRIGLITVGSVWEPRLY